MMKTPIAIDGPAASGKGTIASKVAKYFNFAYLDTGILYRGIAQRILSEKNDPSNETLAVAMAKKFDITKINLTTIRTHEIGIVASQISQYDGLRTELLQLQRHFAYHPPFPTRGAILDGRDIGTIICPDAPIKIFITAHPEIRAHRRWLEYKHRDHMLTEAEILEDIKLRDTQDRTRKIAPLKPAKDALLLDTSYLSIAESFEQILQLIKDHA